MKTKALVSIINGVRKALEEDSNHQIHLKEDYHVGTFNIPMPDYDCNDFYIKDRRFVVKKEAACIDGASKAPDKLIIDIACGYIPHDVWYEHLQDMAEHPDFKVLGYDYDKLRKIGDDVFGIQLYNESNKQTNFFTRQGSSLVARIYYNAVRLFGGLYNKLNRSIKLLCIIFATSFLIGCSGCATPDQSIFTSSDASPQYEIIYHE